MSAQDDAVQAMLQADKKLENSQSQQATVVQVQPWSERLVLYLSIEVLVFTVIALVLASLILKRSNQISPLHILRVLGIITILGLSTLLLVVGYSNEQLTPIVGLFGAIAGYLLGKDVAHSESNEGRTRIRDSADDQ